MLIRGNKSVGQHPVQRISCFFIRCPSSGTRKDALSCRRTRSRNKIERARRWGPSRLALRRPRKFLIDYRAREILSLLDHDTPERNDSPERSNPPRASAAVRKSGEKKKDKQAKKQLREFWRSHRTRQDSDKMEEDRNYLLYTKWRCRYLGINLKLSDTRYHHEITYFPSSELAGPLRAGESRSRAYGYPLLSGISRLVAGARSIFMWLNRGWRRYGDLSGNRAMRICDLRPRVAGSRPS